MQLGVFGELRALFPGVQLHMDFVGPAVPQFRFVYIIHLVLLVAFASVFHARVSSCTCSDLQVNYIQYLSYKHGYMLLREIRDSSTHPHGRIPGQFLLE